MSGWWSDPNEPPRWIGGAPNNGSSALFFMQGKVTLAIVEAQLMGEETFRVRTLFGDSEGFETQAEASAFAEASVAEHALERMP